VNIDEDTKRKIIDLRYQHKKKIREIVQVVGKSSRDVTAVLRKNKIKQAQTTKDKEEHEVDKGIQNSHDHDDPLANVKAYKLFDEGKSPLEVTAELNLPGPQVQQYYVEYWNLRRMYKLVTIYQELQGSVGYFLKLVRLGKKEGLTPEQIINRVQMADNIHRLQEKFQHLQSELIDIAIRKTAAKKELNDMQNEIEAAQKKLNSVDRASNMKYEELKKVYSQARKLQNYVEEFKNGQDYKELEAMVRSEVVKTLLDNKKLLQNALVSVIVGLRNDPDRYLLIDRMELTPFTTNAIINYNSSLALRRPPYLQGNEQFVTERVLKMAEKILYNLQKGLVDSTIATAAGLEKDSSFPTTDPALPNHQSSNMHLDRGLFRRSI
jgi:hypothetical protein